MSVCSSVCVPVSLLLLKSTYVTPFTSYLRIDRSSAPHQSYTGFSRLTTGNVTSAFRVADDVRPEAVSSRLESGVVDDTTSPRCGRCLRDAGRRFTSAGSGRLPGRFPLPVARPNEETVSEWGG